MNKKFLSAVLFGALMVTSTGTFTSCKDYDDDIDNLQGQIDKLATKEDMSSQIATLQAALNTAAKDASDAISKATAAEVAAKAAGDEAAAAKAAADKAVAAAKEEAIKAAQAEVNAAKAELEKLVADGLGENKAELEKMAKKVEEATKKVEAIVGEIADMVTSVELIKSFSLENEFGISLSTAIEKANVFSEGIANKITFVKDAEVQTPGQFLIRVSPANAVLKPEMISLVNSQGKNLDDILEVVKVEKSTELLSAAPKTARAAENSGLWNVTVQLRNYGDGKAFEAATTTKVNNQKQNILFAAQVNNSLTTSEVRYATSSYDLTLGWRPFEAANKLNYFVDKTNVENVNNRYDNNSLSLKEHSADIIYKELVWKGEPAVAPITDNPSNVKQGDYRSDKEVYPAVQGQAIKIALSTENDKIEAPANIRAIYVTLDKANAVESAPSELNAWNSYTYSGLNTVVEGTSTEITINSTTAINDIIGFRVYAVNYDGTLVDPDGKAFYVNLGDEAADWNATATKVTALSEENLNVKSEEKAVSLSKLVNPTEATWTTDKIGETTPVFNAYFVNADGNVVYNTKDLNSVANVDFSKVVKVYTMPATITDWKSYEDNKAYNGTLTIKNASKHVLAVMNISMTKVLPTGIPAGFSVKTAQVAAGVYNCYLVPDSWDANSANNGTMKMTEVFNFGEGTPAKYNIKFADSKVVNNKKDAITVTGDGTLTVAKDFINNEDKHATTVVYNYGKISSIKNDKGGYDDVTRAATDFQTIYNCIYNNTYKFDWATNEQAGTVNGVDYTAKDNKGNYINALPSKELTYGTDRDFAVEEFIYGTSAWDGIYSAKLSAPYKASLVVKSATLTSDANKKAEYFTVNIDKTTGKITGFNAVNNSSTTNPTAAVPSTLTINAEDMYGHKVVITVAMTVNKR